MTTAPASFRAAVVVPLLVPAAEDAREACLQQLLIDTQSVNARRLVLEPLEPKQEQRDRQVIYHAMLAGSKGYRSPSVITQSPAPHRPMMSPGSLPQASALGGNHYVLASFPVKYSSKCSKCPLWCTKHQIRER